MKNRKNINQHHVQHFFILFIFALFAAAFFYKPEIKETRVVDSEIRRLFPKVELTGKSAYVADIKTGEVFYKKNEDKSLPIASIVKIMTSVVALEVFNKDEVIKIPERGLDAEGESGLKVGEEWRLGDLVSYMMMVSSNDAAYSLMLLANEKLAPETLVKSMNKKTRELGMENSYYYNTSGLDREEFVGGYSTARDVATVSVYAYQTYPEIFSITSKYEWQVTSQSGVLHDAQNTDDLTKERNDIVFSKTGFTDNDGGSLVIINDDKVHDPFVVVVLDSTLEGRFDDVSNLIQKTKEYLGEVSK